MFKKRAKIQPMESTRVVIIGSGNVGASSAFALLIQGIASEIVLVDRDKKKAQGEVMDLEHGISFAHATRVWAGDYSDCRDADVIVITAGAKQKPGQSRLDLIDVNTAITKDIVQQIKKYTKKAVILMVTNPLDITTYTAIKTANFPAGQIFGTGTTLDSSRFRYLIAKKLDIDPESVGAYLLGEHGDSSVPIFSHANVMGETVQLKHSDLTNCYKEAKNAAYAVINRKGATYYAIALAVSRIVRAILFDEKHVFTVSVMLRGEYGLKDVCLSVPAIVGRGGATQVINVKLSAMEKKLLHKSAQSMKQAMSK